MENSYNLQSCLHWICSCYWLTSFLEKKCTPLHVIAVFTEPKDPFKVRSRLWTKDSQPGPGCEASFKWVREASVEMTVTCTPTALGKMPIEGDARAEQNHLRAAGAKKTG